MIDLYFAPTPNGRKVTIMLEECELPYRIVPVDISAGDQFSAEYIAINPNSKIPAIVDHDGPDGKPIQVFESGAILMYLGNKVGRFFPQEPRQRANVTQWLMWQMAGFGPMLGQAHHFFNAAPQQIPYAQNRYHREAQRLYKVLDTQLTTHEYVADAYSIADMAIYPWVAARKAQRIELIDYPHVQRWVDLLKQRPALQRGFGVGRE